MDRNKAIVRTSLVGIGVNLILVGFKAFVGYLSGSIAIIMDAINNLSDALSSVITIIGTKLASRKPDREHPFGHGRIEYISSIIIAILVIMAGVASLSESWQKIVNPVEVNYTAVTLIVVSTGILAKFLLGKYVRKKGEELYSDALIASGMDASFDAIITFSTLAAALIYLAFNLRLEGYIGIIISCLIIKSGFEILMESLSSIIGVRVDDELTSEIKETINTFPQVNGTFDLILHRYGPEQLIGSVHIAVDDEMTARDIHRLTHEISTLIFKKYNIILTVGIYASNNSTELSRKMNARLNELISANPEILQMHGFYIDEENKNVSFDMIFDYGVKETDMIKNNIIDELKKDFPEFTYNVVIDSNYSES